jgi:hypothetical protein
MPGFGILPGGAASSGMTDLIFISQQKSPGYIGESWLLPLMHNLFFLKYLFLFILIFFFFFLEKSVPRSCIE